MHWVLELQAEATELQVIVHDHEVSSAFLVPLLEALNPKGAGRLKLAKSSHHLGVGVESSSAIYHFTTKIVF